VSIRWGGRGDHPRSRGVYLTANPSIQGHPGSSPLARGLPDVEALGLDEPRIIPARAGFTPTRPCRGKPTGDHPRSRGVYRMRVSGTTIAEGSSPLARGLPVGRTPRQQHRGIIPARAGFT